MRTYVVHALVPSMALACGKSVIRLPEGHAYVLRATSTEDVTCQACKKAMEATT